MTPGHAFILQICNEAGYFPLKSELRFINTLSGTLATTRGDPRKITDEQHRQLILEAVERYMNAKAANGGKRPDVDALHADIRSESIGFKFGFRSKE